MEDELVVAGLEENVTSSSHQQLQSIIPIIPRLRWDDVVLRALVFC